MTRAHWLAAAVAATVIVSAGSAHTDVGVDKTNGLALDGTRDAANPETLPEAIQAQGVDSDGPASVTGAAPLFNLNWYTIDGGGDHRLPGTNVNLGVSVGQSVSGTLAGSAYKLGLGFWFATACPIALSGDVNVNGLVSTSDIVHLVNYALKGGPPPLPCIANGDVNCNGAVSVSDIVVLVNKVLKAGPEPCNVCTIIPSLWNCP